MPRENVGFVSYAQPQVMSIGAAKASPTQTNRQLIKTNSNTKIKSRNDYEEIVLQLQVTVCMDSSTKGILNRHQQQMHFAIADCLSQRTLGANFNASHLTLAILLGAAVPPSSWFFCSQGAAKASSKDGYPIASTPHRGKNMKSRCVKAN